jgi:carboxypeptidase Taq
VTRLIERAQASADSLEDWQVANLREMRRQRDHSLGDAQCADLSPCQGNGASGGPLGRSEAVSARYTEVAPYLAEVVALTRDRAALLGQHLGLDPYDALLDEFSPGVLYGQRLDPLFKTLARRLPAMVQEGLALQAGTPSLPIHGRFPVSRQRALCVDAMKALGFPFERGRLDESEHSFTEGITGDLRVTTHFELADPFHGLMAALHETGHALYQLGLPLEWRDQPVGRSRGLALEESQSLLLEMCVVRSRPFLIFLKPMMDRHLGGTGPAWEVDNLYRHISPACMQAR